jgi:hypothetical protein
MIGKVVVMEPAEYQAWLAGGVEGTLAERGGGCSRTWRATPATSTPARAAGRR